MRSQSPQEMLQIAIPMILGILAFVVLMGGFFTTTTSVAQSFIPHKITSMVAHSLTGSTDCLTLGGPQIIPHKGLLDRNKIDNFVSSYPDFMPACVDMPCWVFQAKIKDIDTSSESSFGYKSGDSEFWSTADVVTKKLPIIIDLNGTRHFGKLTIEVKALDSDTCNTQITNIVSGTGGVA